MGLISFLFGKAPEITFTPEGRTAHELDPKKWEEWNDRFRKNPNYDFHKHSGTTGAKDDLKSIEAKASVQTALPTPAVKK
jgi:hypothetical protein